MKKIMFILLGLFLGIGIHPLPSQIKLGVQQLAWNQAMNKGEDLDKFYWDQPTLFLSHEIYKGNAQIQEQLATLIKTEGQISRYINKGIVFHGKNNYFEMGYYVFEKGRYGFLIGWKKVEETWLREIEVLFKAEDAPEIDIAEIDAARNKWMKLSNAHDPAALIKQVYTSDAVYVNQGKVDQGTEAITKRYAYMSNPNWKIQLNHKKSRQIQGNIFFEIGEYVSNGKGHYVIIWEKQENGEWQACLDFNF